MKNIKLILVLFLTIIFVSCGDSVDRNQCLNSVKEIFPNAKIYTPHGGSCYTFFVIDSVNTYRVNTGSLLSSKVTSIEVLVENKQ